MRPSTQLDMPCFQSISPDTILKSIQEHIDAIRTRRKTASTQPKTWANWIAPLMEAQIALEQCFSPFAHLAHVAHTDALGKTYEQAVMLLSTLHTELALDSELYDAYRHIQKEAGLNAEQTRTIQLALRDFELAGVHLPDDKKETLQQTQLALSQHHVQFEQNVLATTQAWSYTTSDVSELAGIPESTQASVYDEANNTWTLTLAEPCYRAVLKHAENRPLREQFYKAYLTRASSQGPHDVSHDNTPVIAHILEQRHTLSTLLDFPNYAHLSLADKMADSPETVLGFLKTLVTQLTPAAIDNYAELETLAHTDNIDTLAPWDIAYYDEKLKQHTLNLSQETLRAYFPLEHVLSVLFDLIESLFGVTFVEMPDVKTWHPDVRVYTLEKKEHAIGACYLDLFARTNKRSGAWMDGCQSRHRTHEGTLHLPIAFLTCNFTPPTGNASAQLTHDEVLTLFHETGHTLHHLLTSLETMPIAGINGVPWDAVEFPSQFLEQWCWEPAFLEKLSCHTETKDALSTASIQNLVKSRQHHAARALLRQIEFAWFDLALHETPGKKAHEIRQDIHAHFPGPQLWAHDTFENAFSHIFAGGYAAGYYSYLWAEQLALDAFSFFKEDKLWSKDLGQHFLDSILSQGGFKEPLALFETFAHRAPNPDALLQTYGVSVS